MDEHDEAAGGKSGADERMVARSPRQVRAAAGILHKEARRILKKHSGRIATEPVAAMRSALVTIEHLRKHEDLRELQRATERLDELLAQHASFARKSELRETLEYIGIVVCMALSLRACLYEPFKIPSGSMMPTLLTGDHIFVNKFVYGIQIPFTTTVVGGSLGHIERGDVIVFRYPVDETQDFIKRVIGLPGDEVKVEGRRVSIRRAGQEEFEVLARRRLADECVDTESDELVANCTLYEETIDDKVYVVRYELDADERNNPRGIEQVWKVPEGHLMVMGDNRNDSLDSRRWTVPVEAVKADGLLTTKDLRDITEERLFSMDRPVYFDEQADYSHDLVIYKVSHRALDHDLLLELEAWMRPPEGLPGKLAALREAEGGMETDDAALPGAWAKADEAAVTFVFAVLETETVLRLRCSKGLCPTRETAVALAQRAAQRAREPENFVDPEAERPLPFVPRGNVMGRAERIWWPPSRIWWPVR